MSTWYYYNEQGEKIEVTGGQLKGLAKAGRITPETIVETEDGKTAPARKVKGLTFVMSTPPIELEIYGVSQPKPPPEPSPFTSFPPEATRTPIAAPAATSNPFTAAMPVVAKPVDNPFTATMPIANQVMPQSDSVSGWAVYAAYSTLLAPIILLLFWLLPF